MVTKRTLAATSRPARLKVGEVFAVPLDDGRFTACQILAIDAEGPIVADLRWIGAVAPALDALRETPLLQADHHSWRGEIAWRRVVPASLPPVTWRSLGVLPVSTQAVCNSYAGWRNVGREIVAQARWDALPEAARRAYKATPYPSRAAIELDLGATKLTMRTHASSAKLSSGDASVRWSELDRLPRLSEIDYAGTDGALLEYVCARPMIDTLGWSGHGRAELDLRGTNLVEVRTSVDAPLRLLLPSGVRALRVTGDPSLLTVVHPTDGRTLELELYGDVRGAPLGIPALRHLSIVLARRVAIAPLLAFPALTHLRVHGEVVEVPDPEQLAGLRALRQLAVFQCYRLDVAKLPRAAEAWPDLERVSIDGFRKVDAARWKACLAGVRTVELRGGKTDAYLAANLDNPFRDWADRSAARGRKATAAWRRARGALVEGLPRDACEAVLRAFVDGFNAFDDVDTIDREEIGEAFFGLARAAGIPDAEAASWFDAWRDF